MFDIKQFATYREDNRLEAKKLKADFRTAYGRPIQHSPTPTAASFSSEPTKSRTVHSYPLGSQRMKLVK